jgi:UDP-N-acetylmuramoyl-tripeptide--D-alanyl-D-alanine ligase
MGYKDISARLNAFEFPPGRLKIIRFGDIKFIDDTYNSNPFSLRQALNSLYNFKVRGRKIFVMGDMRELGIRTKSFHRQAGREAAKACDIFITVGELSRVAAGAAKDYGLNENKIFSCGSCAEAKEILFNDVSLAKDDIVLVKGSRSMKMEGIFKI